MSNEHVLAFQLIWRGRDKHIENDFQFPWQHWCVSPSAQTPTQKSIDLFFKCIIKARSVILFNTLSGPQFSDQLSAYNISIHTQRKERSHSFAWLTTSVIVFFNYKKVNSSITFPPICRSSHSSLCFVTLEPNREGFGSICRLAWRSAPMMEHH